MKKNTSSIRAAIAILTTSVAMSAATAAAFDWKSSMTVAPRQRDAHGNLLPLQSYDETINRGMSFILDDHLKWFKGPADTLVDESGKTQMPWVYYSNVQHNGEPFPSSVDCFVSYPASSIAMRKVRKTISAFSIMPQAIKPSGPNDLPGPFWPPSTTRINLYRVIKRSRTLQISFANRTNLVHDQIYFERFKKHEERE